MARERIEDLGKLAILLRNIMKVDIWELYHGRKKDFVEQFGTWTEEKKDDFLHSMIYGLEDVSNQIYECMSIADGTDEANETNEANYGRTEK